MTSHSTASNGADRPPITLYIRDKATKDPLAEIHVDPNATIGDLRSHIRDCPEMAGHTHRLFSHWWVLSRRSVFPLEIPTDDAYAEDYLLAEAGVEDEGTLLLELRQQTGRKEESSPACGGDESSSTAEQQQQQQQQQQRDSFAAAVASDRRSELRSQQLMRVLVRIEDQLQAVRSENAALRRDNEALQAHVCGLTDDVKRLQTAGDEARQQLTVVEEKVSVAAREQRELSQNIPKPSVASPARPCMLVSSSCGPSTFSVSYPNNGQLAEVIGHELFYTLPLGTVKRLRSVYFPNARVPLGARCLIEFTFGVSPHSPKLEKDIGLAVGFAPRTSTCLVDPNRGGIRHDSNAFTYTLYGRTLRKGDTVLADLAPPAAAGVGAGSLKDRLSLLRDREGRYKEGGSSDVASGVKHRVALLLDRTGPTKKDAYLRAFVSEDGTDEGMKALGVERQAIEPLAGEDYVPVANPVGRCQFTVLNIYFNDTIPPYYADS